MVQPITVRLSQQTYYPVPEGITVFTEDFLIGRFRSDSPYVFLYLRFQLIGVPAAVTDEKPHLAVRLKTHVNVGFHLLEVAAYI